MQNVAGIRRNIKNLAHNYSDAQIKVREATSNDPWGPNSTLMSEIADLTYNVVAFTEIMQLIWKRLNDHGKNWRHVYKSLVLLEYLIKTGSEKVAAQCKDNIHNIQTLKDFQYYEEVKDQGINVREKAKQLVNLLKDDERLRNERARALKAKERFAQSSGRIGYSVPSEGGSFSTPSSPTFRADGQWGSSERPSSFEVTKEIESARPQTVGEEELQLQLALAMSREEAEQEEQRRRSDDVRLQLALSQSQHEFTTTSPTSSSSQQNSHMLDLLDVSLGAVGTSEPQLDPWGMPQRPPPMSKPPPVSNSPWTSTPSVAGAVAASPPPPPLSDPWAPINQPQPITKADPWRPTSPGLPPAPADPWSPTDHSSPLGGTTALSTPSELDDFDIITNRDKHILSNGNNNNNNNNNGTSSPDPFDFSELSTNLNDITKPSKKSPHSFLGENSALVNLDNLVTVTPKTNQVLPQNAAGLGTPNPFTGLPQPQLQVGTTAPNLFQQPIPIRPSINQMRQQTGFGDDTILPSPLVPTANPFLS